MAAQSPRGEAAEPPTAARGDSPEVAEPERLLCPVTHVMYRDPCFVPDSGNTYERSAVEQYWSSLPRPRDPLTNVDLRSRALHPNWGVRREVQRFLDEHPDYVPQGWPGREVPPPAGGVGSAAGRSSFLALSSRRTQLVAAGVVAVLSAFAFESQRLSGSVGDGILARHALAVEISELHPPKGSRLQAWKGDDALVVYVPARGMDADMAARLFFGCFWTGFTGVWTAGAWSAGAPAIFVMFSLPFWGVGFALLASLLKECAQRETLHLGMAEYRLSKDVWRFSLPDSLAKIADLSGPPSRQCDGDRCWLLFEDGIQEMVFGGSSLQAAEARWVQEAVQQHLVQTPGGDRFNVQPTDRTVERRRARSDHHHTAQLGAFSAEFVIR